MIYLVFKYQLKCVSLCYRNLPMKNFIKYLTCFILLAQGNLLFSQQEILSADKTEKATFTIKGSVYEKESHEPISQVNIEVNGGQYSTTNFSGEFKIH